MHLSGDEAQQESRRGGVSRRVGRQGAMMESFLALYFSSWPKLSATCVQAGLYEMIIHNEHARVMYQFV